MGLFSKKTESVSLSDAVEILGDARKLKGMSKQEIKDLQAKAKGKPQKLGDIRAGIDDFKKGRKGSQGAPMPPPRKGRSMW